MTDQTRRRRIAAVTAAIAASVVSLPSTAGAAYSGTAAAAAATLTGDATAEALTVGEAGGLLTQSQVGNGFNSPTDFDSTVAGDQTLPANGTAVLTINAGGGDDTITVTSANVNAASTFDGGAGNDLLTGAAGVQLLRGGDGNDRLVGATGNDDMEGGAGNDVLVWNNGDGSDVMDGDAGFDEIEVNGAATAADTFTIAPNAERVKFDRTNLVPFTLDIGASERLNVNGLGGDDAVASAAGLAPLIALNLNGGVGADTLTGGDGADLITGGEDNDALAGGGGDDRIVGDRGNDTIGGGAGDDTLVWNNGDGSDKMDGEDGSDRVEVNGATNAGDAFTVGPNAARAKFDRTNLVPFTLDIGSHEVLEVNGSGGDDTLAVAAGIGALAVTADGGSGNDQLTGAEGNETFAGGSGNDVLTGGGGRDVVDGQAGDDRLELRDGAEDLGRGGEGRDSATSDRVGVDALDSVEQAKRSTAAKAAITSSRVAVRFRGSRATTRIALNCATAEASGCRGTLTLVGTVRSGGRGLSAVVGTAPYSLRAGQRRTITLRLVTGLRSIAGGRTLRVNAQAVTRGASAVATKRVTLRIPGR